MFLTRIQQSSGDRRMRPMHGAAAVGFAAAALLFAAAAAAAGGGGTLATYRGGTVTRGEFEVYQTRKIGADEYRNLLSNRPALRDAVLRQAMLEVVAGLAGEVGLRESAAFKGRLRNQENELLAALWRGKVEAGVKLTDAELDRMIPEQRAEVVANWVSLATKEEAARFAAALRAGSKFSEAGSAAGVPGPTVGELRLSERGGSHFSPESEAKILSLAAGEVAGPLQEPIGWYVVQCVERTDPDAWRRRERERLRPEVLRAARGEALAEAAAALRAKAEVTIDEKALADPEARAAGARVATVNGEPVYFSQQTPHGFPQHGEMERLLRRQLDRQVEEMLQAQEARRLGLAAGDPQWKERVEGYALDLLNDLYRERVYEQFTISEEEVRDYFAKNPELFKTRTMVRLRQIVLNSAYLARRYRDDLLAGRAQFEELARRESIDRGSAQSGGDQGWMPEEAVRDEFRQYVEALRPGEISVPLETGGVFYLIKLEARSEPELIPYEQSSDRVRSRALLAKRTASWQEFLERKLKEAQVKLDDAGIDALAARAP